MKTSFFLISLLLVVQICKSEGVCDKQFHRKLIGNLQTVISDIKESGCEHSTTCINCQEYETPAFTATSSKSQFLTGPNHIAKFEKVWTNIGGGYSPHTGVFTVPRSGLYQISGTVLSHVGKYLHVHLWKNDISIIGLYPGPGFHSGSVSLALQLQKGDRVYIKHTQNNTEELFSNHHTYVVFSGFLISKK